MIWDYSDQPLHSLLLYPYIIYISSGGQMDITFQGSHRNSKTEFHDFSMIFHDHQCNFHDYLMHGLQPPLLTPSSPRWA